MNRTLLLAALLAAFTAAVHVFVGTPEIKGPLLQSALPQEVRLLLYACWHLVSVTLTLSAAALFVSARPSRTPPPHHTVKLVSCLWLCFGLVFIVVALLYSGPPMLLELPQWALLLPVGALGLWGCSDRSLPSPTR